MARPLSLYSKTRLALLTCMTTDRNQKATSQSSHSKNEQKPCSGPCEAVPLHFSPLPIPSLINTGREVKNQHLFHIIGAFTQNIFRKSVVDRIVFHEIFSIGLVRELHEIHEIEIILLAVEKKSNG